MPEPVASSTTAASGVTGVPAPGASGSPPPPGRGRLVLPRADGRTVTAIFVGGALGTLARAALGDRASRPIVLARGYALPAWTTPDTTVLCSSYSGNTEETLAVYEDLAKDYPQCAWAHNSAAWLSACCRRDLEKGVTHARKAVELAPTSAAHHDTLAEVLFQLGRKDEAVAAQKKAIELDPKRTYFGRQLKRIEAGDPKAERPRDDEE